MPACLSTAEKTDAQLNVLADLKSTHFLATIIEIVGPDQMGPQSLWIVAKAKARAYFIAQGMAQQH